MTSIERAFTWKIRDLNLRHVRPHHLVRHWGRTKDGVVNTPPPPEIWPNIFPTAIVLDHLAGDIEKEYGNVQVETLSVWRAPAYNIAVTKKPSSLSQHAEFCAIDFWMNHETPKLWATRLYYMRGKILASPVTLRPSDFVRTTAASFKLLRLQDLYGRGTIFWFAGGVGVYTANKFVHIDTRGLNHSWGS